MNVLLREIKQFNVAADRLTIDPQAMTILSSDIKSESGHKSTIGSTGQGVGVATARKIIRRSGRIRPRVVLARDVKELKPFVRDSHRFMDDRFRDGARVLLEGTQGTGLSLHHGFYPHVTSRDTTVAGCLAEAGISPSRVRKVVMVCRTYPIRVKSPSGKEHTTGKLSQEIDWKEISKRSGIPIEVLEKTEHTSTTKKLRRVGEFDWTLLRKAASLNAPTDIALTFVDYIDKANEDACRFEQLSPNTIEFIEEVERVSSSPVSLVSTRFHDRAIIDRRKW